MHTELVRNYHSHEGRGQMPPAFPFLLGPAYSVLPWVRTPVGYAHTSPLAALLRAVLLSVLPPIAWGILYASKNEPLPDDIGNLYLVFFVVICALVNCIVWLRRIMDMRRGRDIHEAEAGYSWAAWYLPLPPAVTEIFLVPGLFVLAGWYVYTTVSRDLGAWLVICGLSLAYMALWELRRRVAATFAVSNLKVQGQTTAWRFEQHERRAREPGAKSGAAQRDFAEMASGPAEPPSAFATRAGSDSLAPERAVWFRKRRRQPNSAADSQGGDRAGRRDYAERGK